MIVRGGGGKTATAGIGEGERKLKKQVSPVVTVIVIVVVVVIVALIVNYIAGGGRGAKTGAVLFSEGGDVDRASTDKAITTGPEYQQLRKEGEAARAKYAKQREGGE